MSIVAFVAAGTLATGSSTSVIVSSPAGASGDLLVFVMGHDDFSDGAFVPNAPPITMTTVIDGSPQLADDSLYAIFVAEEDQAASRSFTFDFSLAEGWIARVFRYSGHDSTTPVQAGSALRRASETSVPVDVTLFGSMIFYVLGGDIVGIASDVAAAPSNFTQRAADTGNGMALYVADFILGDGGYPFPFDPGDVAAAYPNTGVGPFGSNGTINMTFVISSDPTARTIAGITKDKAGVALPSVDVALFKKDVASPPGYVFVDKQVSNGTTGAYSFTVEEDNDSQFLVVGNLQGSPDVMDCTTNELTPT